MKGREQLFFSMLPNVELIDFPGAANLGDFSCSVDDYRDFLVNDAPKFSELNLTRVKLLLDRETGNIIAYMALLCDAIQLDTEEVQQMGWDIPFRTIPALKIGKLAVNQAYERHHYGSFMLWLALGFAENLLHEGIACRVLTVDADVLSNSDTPAFYQKNGFVENQRYRSRTNSVSMRYDILSSE